ncbi:MAG: hypothetical protein ACQEW0_01920 [Pseudomonadota bacterium]
MNKQLFLHIGFHKTASSSFQYTCKSNVEKLKQLGFNYPLFNSDKIRRKNIENHSIPLTYIFGYNLERYHVGIKNGVSDIQGLISDYFDFLKLQLQKSQRMILSAEDFSIFPNSMIASFFKLVEKYRFEIVPIAYVRSPYDFHCSYLQQRAKGGGYQNFSIFNSQQGKVELLDNSIPLPINYYPFREACDHRYGPVGHLFEIIGVSADNIKINKANDGISNIATRVQNRINKNEPRIKDGRLNECWFDVKDIGLNLTGEKFRLTEKEFQNIYADYQIEVDFFKSKFGDKFLDSSIKLLDADSAYDETVSYILNNFSVKN